MLFLLIVLEYKSDVKKYGKDNVAVPLRERLIAYATMIAGPILLVALTEFIGRL